MAIKIELMKPLKITVPLAFLLFFSYSCAVQQKQQQQYSQNETVDFQIFYDELSPYGHWVDYSNYGYIWIPDVRREFTPYATNGHWVMTDYGWTWVSDYRWGWAPFHYGRWDYDDYYGWFWVPDNEWGPAWVSWRSGNGYYGWAPMRPGMNIHNSFNDNYRDIGRWNFVRDRDFGRRDIDRYFINRGNYTTIINNTTVINNTTTDRRRNATYVSGPEEDNVQRATGRNINRVRIQDHERPGQKLDKDQLTIYRPEVQRTTTRRAAPPKVTDIQEIKPVRERGSGNQRRDVAPIENSRDQQPSEAGRSNERRRILRQGQQQPPAEKSTQVPQTTTSRPDVTPAQEPNQNNRRRVERMERQREQQIQRQNRQMQQTRPEVPQQPTTPQAPQTERREIQQEQQIRQDRTKQEQLEKQQQAQVQRQQAQVERQQQQLERQQQQQRRRQERQEIRQQQQMEKSQPVPPTQPSQQTSEQEERKTLPSGSRRR